MKVSIPADNTVTAASAKFTSVKELLDFIQENMDEDEGHIENASDLKRIFGASAKNVFMCGIRDNGRSFVVAHANGMALYVTPGSKNSYVLEENDDEEIAKGKLGTDANALSSIMKFAKTGKL